jgi:hypothetical protein
MKKFIICIFPVLLAWPSTVQGQFSFVTNNGTIQITRYDGTNNAVVVPSSINGLPVTSIAQWTFTCRNVTSVSLPESITNIGDAAFESSLYLTNLTIPSAVTHLGNGVFDQCWSLTGISFPTNLMTIGDQAFQDCRSLTCLTFPATVTSIGADAFFNSGLTNLIVGASLTNIGGYAFMGCAKLTNLIVNGHNPAYSSSGGVLFNTALVADALAGTVLPFVGLPDLMPLPWWKTFVIFGYAMVSCLVANDAMKVAMTKWRVLTAVARRKLCTQTFSEPEITNSPTPSAPSLEIAASLNPRTRSIKNLLGLPA